MSLLCFASYSFHIVICVFYLFKQEDGLLTDDISNVLEDLLEVQAQEGEQQFEDDVCSLPDDWCVEHLDVS